MKPRIRLLLAAAVGLSGAIFSTGATFAAAPTTAQVVQVTMIQTLCPSYTVVPANRTPTQFDQTGGHGAELDNSYQKILVNPATDIPSVCRPADGWQFQMFGDPGLSTPVGSPVTTGADGAGTGATTVTLDPTELALAQTTGAPTGLWIAEVTQPSVAGFGALRCYNDMNNGDDAENIQSIGTATLHMYCIAYSVLPPATFHPIDPTRILDSRFGTGLAGRFFSHVPRTFQVTGLAGIPAGATAITGNLTVTNQTRAGYLFMGPVPQSSPTSSTLNFPLKDTRANGVTVALGAGGTLSVTYVGFGSGASTHVVFDVSGYFTADASGESFVPLNPTRILDSRNGTGLAGHFVSHVARVFQVTGLADVPANATAVTGNLTVTNQTRAGYLFMGPVPENSPTSSTLNFPLKDVRANGLTVALGAGGTLSVTFVGFGSGATAQVVFDVSGYYVP
jgi:hypothetical protein